MADSVDEYGYEERFRNYTVDRLIAAFNADVGNPGWVRARHYFLFALRKALLATGLDCSGFIRGKEMSLRSRIRRDGDAIVPVEPFPPGPLPGPKQILIR